MRKKKISFNDKSLLCEKIKIMKFILSTRDVFQNYCLCWRKNDTLMNYAISRLHSFLEKPFIWWWRCWGRFLVGMTLTFNFMTFNFFFPYFACELVQPFRFNAWSTYYKIFSVPASSHSVSNVHFFKMQNFIIQHICI